MLYATNRDDPAINLSKQVIQVTGNDVDHMFLQGIGRGESRRLPDRLFGPFDIAAAQLREAPKHRDGIIERLPLGGRLTRGGFPVPLGFLRLRCSGKAADLYWRCCPDIGSRRHCRNVGRINDECARRCSMRAAGSDIDDHRHRRGQHVSENISGCGDEPPRCVELNDEAARLASARLRNGVANQTRGRHADHTFNVCHQDRSARFGGVDHRH